MTIAGVGATLSGTYIHISTFVAGTGDPKSGTRTNEALDATSKRSKNAAKLLDMSGESMISDSCVQWIATRKLG